MAVQLRSGKELNNNKTEEKEKTEQEEVKEIGKDNKRSNSESTVETDGKKHIELQEKGCEQKQQEKVQAYMPTVPFPQRLQKAKIEEKFSKFLEIFKKIEINIPFAKAINQMSNYAKFLKDILSKKKKIVEEGVVSLSKICSAIIQHNLPTKMKDPGSFTILTPLGNMSSKRPCLTQVPVLT